MSLLLSDYLLLSKPDIEHGISEIYIKQLKKTYREVVSVQEKFSEQFERLSPRHVVVGVEQFLVVVENLVVVGLQEFCSQHLVLRQ